MSNLNYNETIDIQGIRVPFVSNIITPRIERQMRIGKYEAGECSAIHKWVRSGDRVLELGAGIGLISSAVSKVGDIEKIVSIEANPELIELIRETHRINNIENVDLRNGIAAQSASEGIPFYIRPHFWASSMEPDSAPYSSVKEMLAYGLDDLIKEVDPTVIIADIEGGEIDLFNGHNLEKVRTVIIELHPLVYGIEGQKEILKAFHEKGFKAEESYLAGSVWVLTRAPFNAVPDFYLRGPSEAAHTNPDPKIAITTCVKNEGPFLLEWIAYHKSIGVTDFVIFSNDCTDGTDEMLDRLAENGVVTHLPNPAVAAGTTYFQPLGMKFAMEMRMIKDADYVIQTDVDEFINIKVGNGHIFDLLKAAGPFHALSISELNFCSNGHWEMQDVWLTEAFREHETPEPGHWQARRGVKSILHGIDNFQTWPVHRPGIFPGSYEELIWLDGSGQQVPEEFVVKHENGIDRRGRYDLVQLDHHPLRSVESYLLKQDRGDVVNANRTVNTHYYRQRALGKCFDGVIDNKLPAARAEWAKLIADPVLVELHKQSVHLHKERLKLVENKPDIAEIRAWIAEHYFPDRVRS